MKIVPQIIGFLAILIWVISIRQKNKKDLALLQVISNGLYGVQYTLLNAISAACMNYLSLIRCMIIYKNLKNKKETPKYIVIVFVIIMIIICIFSYDGILSVVPTFITCLYAYSLWQKDMVLLYKIIIFAAILWIVYNYFVGAYISVIGNIFEIICGIISIKEYKKK